MKNTKSEIVAISIRLITKNQSADYYPFIEEPEARHQFLKRVYQILVGSSALLDIKQHLNEIILIFDANDKNIHRFLSDFPNWLHKIRNDCNIYATEQHWSHTLDMRIAMDAGYSEPIRLFFPNYAFPITNWSGLHVDRVSNITKEMVNGNYPSFLITHALYKRLPLPMQEKFTTLYYIRHICCYSS